MKEKRGPNEENIKASDSSIPLLSPKENRLLAERRAKDRRIANLAVDKDFRIGNRRRGDRRTRKSSKAINFARFLRERGIYPHERAYDQPDGVEVFFKGKKIINLASVDYFNFAQNSEIKKVACEAVHKYGAGGFSSRFSMGYLTIHQELEYELSRFINKKQVLVFNSGYLGNLAVITSIMAKNATIFVDQKCHISIHHACQLSNKKSFRYNNNDMEDLEKLLIRYANEPNKWIITLGVFSSNGYLSNLKEIVLLAKKYKARIFIDDAHGIGVYGDHCRGAAEYLGVLDDIDLIICSFQMAFGNIGAFLAGNYLPEQSHEEIWPYTFTYNIPPVNAASILKALSLLKQKGRELQKKLWDNAHYLYKGLAEIGYEPINHKGHIIPIIISDELKMCEFVYFLFNNGLWVQPFYFPAVPKGKGTIRITCTAGHTKRELDQSLQIFAKGYDLIKHI